jgi:serine/threonine protein kinase/formylglycine-generating enzyme required for sulfatase activity
MAGPSSSPDPSDPLLSLLDQIADLPESQQSIAIEAACRERPDLEPALRRHFSAYRELAGRSAPVLPLQQVGPYRLLETIGEGGMGVVYRAEQSAPIRRTVALKVIKGGHDDRRVVARFERERQALALMNHEGIAKVFDCGTTSSGQPFFVMELVAGDAITRYCARRRSTVRDRLELMIAVCAAVQHAHHKGVVHRDLKPSNILVQDEGGRPRVKVIDFGLAKALMPDLLDQDQRTEVGALVGTPEYMAPEQIADAGRAADTRADVYSLGVVLYELLVGRLPLASEELRASGFGRLHQVLRDVTPPAPSVRLAGEGAAAAAIAEQRQVAVASLHRQLRSDLDWVVLKALEKEPDRRYESPAALAAELQRVLAFEPVLAGPPRLTYRLRKVVRRYRGQVIAAALVLATAIAGTVASSAYALMAADREQVANQRAADNERLAAEVSALAAAEGQAKEAALATSQRLAAVVEDYELLGSVLASRRTLAREAELVPAWPPLLPAIDAWLRDEVEPLLAKRSRIEAALARLGQRAVAVHEVVAEPPGDQLPRPQNWQEALVRARNLDDLWHAFALASGREQPEGTSSAATRLVFPPEESAAAFLHQELGELLARMDHLRDTLRPAVERRRSWAIQMQQIASTHPRARHSWSEVRLALAAASGQSANTPYAGTRLPLADEDCFGLVPIGRNPVTGLWEFYDLASAWDGSQDPAQIEIPQHEADGGIPLRGGSGIVFVLVPGGEFTMGEPHRQWARSDEQPHRVALSPFLVARHELTRGQWERLGGRGVSGWRLGHRYDGDMRRIAALHPMDSMTWEMVEELLRRHGMALPTEAQWEYACRAGSTTPWWTGDEPGSLLDAANLRDAKAVARKPEYGEGEPFHDGYAAIAPVGTFRANAFGLFDMHGNVAEWCRDWFGFYEGPWRAGDGLRLIDGWQLGRVVRGGSYVDRAESVRSARRERHPAGQGSLRIGARPVRLLRGS